MSLSTSLLQTSPLLSNVSASPQSSPTPKVGIVPSTTDPKVLRETIEKLKQQSNSKGEVDDLHSLKILGTDSKTVIAKPIEDDDKKLVS